MRVKDRAAETEQKEREWDRERDRERETERDRERMRERDRERDSWRKKETGNTGREGEVDGGAKRVAAGTGSDVTEGVDRGCSVNIEGVRVHAQCLDTPALGSQRRLEGRGENEARGGRKNEAAGGGGEVGA